jgi:putative ABC transport system permease protein
MVCSPTRRRNAHEIGIRIALGATQFEISRLVLMNVLLGDAGQAVTESTLGVSTADPLTLGAVVLLIAMVALVAAIVPARRATAVDPTTALRAE